MPRVLTGLGFRDVLGAAMVRSGFMRGSYCLTPGLYCVGNPGPRSPVLVTANYKLSFDTLRSRLHGVNAWILVADTRGVNVWCAAGKALFSTQEIVLCVAEAELDKVVEHRLLVLPQLSATGVDALAVRRESGFSVVWGPVRAEDVKLFLARGMKAGPDMRRVTFSLAERMAVAPVELTLFWKPMLVLALVALLLSGIGPWGLSLEAMVRRGVFMGAALGSGVLAGALGVPAFLPWLPGRAFAVKGAVAGALAGTAAVWAMEVPGGLVAVDGPVAMGIGAMILAAMAVGSWMGMNFTGSTPYTSPSGVEYEMRRAMPVQAVSALASAGLWLASAFLGGL